MLSSSRWRTLVAERILPRLTPRGRTRALDAAFRLGWFARRRLGIDTRRAPVEGEIDAWRVIDTESVESLAAEAERYFSAQAARPLPSRKPFTSAEEASEHLIAFSHILMGLQVLPGMRVLDFGAGQGWTSRLFRQLNCDVVVCDVSATALEQARRALEPLGPGPGGPTRFLHFDGHHLDLPDASVDRISVFDAFHHVPNQDEVLAEFSRVLRAGGIAGFCEPGPNHSKTAASQHEMRNYRVLENDILVADISRRARRLGFSEATLSLFMRRPSFVSIAAYQRYLRSGQPPTSFRREMHGDLLGSRTFFLAKGDGASRDSRQPHGLRARLSVSPVPGQGGPVARCRVSVANVGTADWLPSGTTPGSVWLGAHLYGRDHELVALDFARYPLPFDGRLGPGASVEFEIEVVVPRRPAVVRFDVVSEGVAWFELTGSRTVEVELGSGEPAGQVP